MYQVKFTCGQKWTACLTEQESYFQSKLEAADKMNYMSVTQSGPAYNVHISLLKPGLTAVSYQIESVYV